MLSTNIFYSGYNTLFAVLSIFIGLGSVFMIRSSEEFRSMFLFQIGALALILLTYLTLHDHILYTIGLSYNFVIFLQSLIAIVISVLWINSASQLYSNRFANGEISAIYITLAVTGCIYYSFVNYQLQFTNLLNSSFILLGISLLLICSIIKLFKAPNLGSTLFSLSLIMLASKLVVSNFFYHYNWLNLNIFNWLWIYVFAAAMIFISFDIYKEDLMHSWNTIDRLNLQIHDMILSSPLPIIIVDALDYKIKLLNNQASLLFGISKKECDYVNLTDLLIDKQNQENFYFSINQKQILENFDVMVCNLISGSPFWLSVSAKFMEYNGNNSIYLTFQDINLRKEYEKNILNHADRDQLTKLWNRRYFEKLLPLKIADCIKNSQPFSLLLLDLDKFKKFNEKHGYQVGDKFLTSISKICTERVNNDEAIIARFGGEEIIIFAPNMDLASSLNLAESLRSAVENFSLSAENGTLLQLTVSLGITSSALSTDSDTLLRQVDDAMHLAKKNGRNSLAVYDASKVAKSSTSKSHSRKRDIHPVFQNEEVEEISLLDSYDNKIL